MASGIRIIYQPMRIQLHSLHIPLLKATKPKMPGLQSPSKTKPKREERKKGEIILQTSGRYSSCHIETHWRQPDLFCRSVIQSINVRGIIARVRVTGGWDHARRSRRGRRHRLLVPRWLASRCGCRCAPHPFARTVGSCALLVDIVAMQLSATTARAGWYHTVTLGFPS